MLVCPFGTDVMRASGLRVYAAAGYASARWGMSSQAVVTWEWDEAAGRKGFERAKSILDEVEADASGRLKGIVFPQQIDTVSEVLFRESFAYAEATGRPFMSHLAQTVVEVREMIRRHGITPVAWAAKIGILAPRTTMGHCIFLDEHPQIGWHTQRVYGNDIAALVAAFDAARALTDARPRVIICDTQMARGVPFLETRDKTHFLRVEAHEWQLALEALDAGRNR